MKKFLLSSLVITSIFAFAYTSIDVENANYLAAKNIITPQIYEIKYRLDDSITRAEIVGIALKMKGVKLPADYTCKNYFSDVRFVPFSNDQWICRAVELAADAGFVSRANTTFRPQDKVTRAEAFAIIYKSSGLRGSSENYHFFTEEGEAWQKDLFYKIYNLGLTLPGTTKQEVGAGVKYNWSPNKFATRAEIFGFAKNILEYKETTSCTLNSPSFTCENVTQGMEFLEPNYTPPKVCGCKPTCLDGEVVIVSQGGGFWPDGSAKGIFTCSSEYPA